jgi:hypothetical protein
MRIKIIAEWRKLERQTQFHLPHGRWYCSITSSYDVEL